MEFESIEAVTVYNNLIKMIEHRQLKPNNVLTKDKIVSELNNREYIIIKAETNGTVAPNNLTVIQTAPESKYATKLAEFRKLFRDIDETIPINILLVSDQELTVHIANYVKGEFKSDHPNISLSAHDYEKFSMDMRTHVSVGVHTICTDAEIALLDRRYLPKTKFSNMNHTDTQAVWLGARPGQLVKVVNTSETAGNEISYRYVI